MPLIACLGAFQLPTHADLVLIREALARAPRCTVLLTGAFRPRSPRYPFTWEERAGLLRHALDPHERPRIDFRPVREGWGDERLRGEMQAAVPDEHVVLLQPANAEPPPVSAGWRIERFTMPAMQDADELIQRLLTEPAFDGLAAIRPHVPGTVAAAIEAWTTRPEWQRLREEQAQIAREKQAWSVAPYPVVLVTVDAVVRVAGHVLLIRRGRMPGQGLRALPGGFVDPAETVHRAAVRELVEETRIDEAVVRAALRGVQVFDDPARSQRGRVITHAHFFDLDDAPLPQVAGGDDAAAAEWVSLDALAGLEDQFMDDHLRILDHFLHLLPPPTTTPMITAG